MNFKLWLWRLFWSRRARRAGGLREGEFFPPFRLTDLEGRPHTVPDPSGKKCTVIWFTNLCDDCRSKIPLLEDLRRNDGALFDIFAVSLLGNDETLPRQASAACGFPFLLDPTDVVGNRLGLPHPPATCPLHNFFVLDQDGRIVFRHHLSALKPETFEATIKKIASGRPPSKT